eukprot:TRINITY_DN10841_c0_g1_i3.p1 TRINITY_DN10841_c0_g1~~TRINITY_DN10841_c0_g1_i3.p1  ORF type:complete len:726 (+),score=184.41 TRINITY_DN10841_c0_g1_i3:86-2263(+)
MIRRPQRSTLSSSSAASDVYKRQAPMKRLFVEAHRIGLTVRCGADNYMVGDESMEELNAYNHKERKLEMYINKFKHSPVFTFTSLERSRLVLSIMHSKLEFGGCDLLDLIQPRLQDGEEPKILDVFPMHDPKELDMLTQSWFHSKDQSVEAGEINMRISQGKRLMGWNTPSELIRDYFGEEIALYSEFVAFFTKQSVFCAVCGVITFFAQLVDGSNTLLTPVYCLVVSLWATVFCEGWKRHEASLRSVWNVEDHEAKEEDRLEFHGEVMLNQITGEYDRVYNPWKKYTQMAISFLFMLSFMAACISAMLAIAVIQTNTLRNSGFAGLVLGSLVNFVLIEVLNRFFKVVAFKLTDFENHQKETAYWDHAIAKTFLFQFVNSYSAFFYTAFIEENVSLFGSDKGCPEDDCMYALRVMLGTVFIGHMVLMQMIEVMWPWMTWRLGLHKAIVHCACCDDDHEEREALSKGSRDVNQDDWIPLTAEEVEYAKQVYMNPFDDYNELLLQFGFVFLFAAAFPLGALLSLLNNIVEIRTDGFKICMLYRRPPYRCAQDIGSWMHILEGLSMLCVVTNCGILGVTSDALERHGVVGDHPTKVQQVLTAVVAEHMILVLKALIAHIIPDEPLHVYERRLRRQRLLAVAQESAFFTPERVIFERMVPCLTLCRWRNSGSIWAMHLMSSRHMWSFKSLGTATDPVSGPTVSYTHLRAHETVLDLVCRLLLEKKKKQK